MKNILNTLLFTLIFTSFVQAQDDKTFEFTYEGRTLKYQIMSETEAAVIKQENPGRTIIYKSHSGVESRDTTYSGPAGNVTIPSEVTFEGKAYEVTSIIKDAFEFNYYLTSITLPSTLNSIDKEAWGDCPELERIEVAADNKYYSSEDGVLFNKAKDTLITFPMGRKNLSYVAPNIVKQTKPHSLRSGLSSIRDMMVESDNIMRKKNLSYVIPSTVKQIEPLALRSIISYIENVEVAADNKYYSSEDGVLFNKAKDTLIAFPMEKEGLSYVIPSTVKQIEPLALRVVNYIKNIEVAPDNKYYSSEDGVLFNKAKDTLIAFPKGKDSMSYVIPSTVKQIEPLALRSIISYIENIEVATDNKYYSSEDGVLFNKAMDTLVAFPQNNKKVAYEIPKSVTTIPRNAFFSKNLKSVTIPKTIKNIEMFAFDRSTVESVIISQGVKKVDVLAFANCSRLKNVSMPKSVARIGMGAFANCDSLERVIIPKGVKTIGDFAFGSCGKLKNVSMPKSVTDIEDWAFVGCKKLDSVKVPESVDRINKGTFACCETLSNLEIPKSVCDIADSAFLGCVDLDSVMLSSSVTSVGADAFNRTEHSYDITLDPDLKKKDDKGTIAYHITCSPREAGWSDFMDYKKTSRYKTQIKETTVTVPDSEKGRWKEVLKNCPRINIVGEKQQKQKESDFPEIRNAMVVDTCIMNLDGDTIWYKLNEETKTASVTFKKEIGLAEYADTVSVVKRLLDAFRTPTKYVGYIGTIAIPEKVEYNGKKYRVTKIEKNAFEISRKLTAVIIPRSVTSIGDKAFRKCNSLTSVSISSGVKKIGKAAFWECYNLERIEVASRNKFFSSVDGVLFSKAKDTLLFFPTQRATCTIPNTVTHIGEAAFLDSDITSIEIPNSVKEIGNDAFNRSSLKEVSIPQSVTKIGDLAFYNCNSLASIVIPNSVISIGYFSFSMCSSLETITVENEEPPTVKELFFRTPIQTIYVPAKSVEKYKTAKGWSEYADKIKAIGE